MIPRQRGEPLSRTRRPQYPRFDPHSWPTVDETAETLAMMTADTVLQVLKGEAVYFGLGDQWEPPQLQQRDRVRRVRQRMKPEPVASRGPLTLKWEEFQTFYRNIVDRCYQCRLGKLHPGPIDHDIRTAARPLVTVHYTCGHCGHTETMDFIIPDL